ncbi:MAG: hypothetical protein E6J03_12600, partial [Chloroflexi bacterium]
MARGRRARGVIDARPPAGYKCAMPAEGVRVRLLGRFEIEGIDTAGVRSRKARTLLRVLALAQGAPVPAARLVDIVWGEEPPSEPADQLSVLVSRLRAVLGAGRIDRSDAGYALTVAWSDLAAGTSFLEEGERRLDAGAAVAARAAATAARRLHRGPLLADEAGAEWVGAERAAAERQLLRIQHLLAAAALASGDPATAAAAAEEALDVDPFAEEALRLLLAAHAAAGRKAAALAVYERFRERLAAELGVDPAPATAAAQLAVLQDRPVPGIAVGEARTAWSEAAAGGAETSAGRLVGRDAELAALDAALDRAVAGDPGVVVVEGEAGIGKSRLVGEWTVRARARGAAVLAGRCDELGRALPLQPVLDALGEHLAGLDSGAVSALLGPEAAVLGDPLLTAGAMPLPAGAVMPVSSDGVARAVIAESVRRVLARIAAHPAVLVVEDVHLADPATEDLLTRLRRHPPSPHLLAVVTRRSGEGRTPDASLRLSLEPLDLAACAQLVGDVEAPGLHRRSGGNPLLLLELSRAGGAADIPESLREAVATQCDRLGPAAATLRAAAVLGPELDLEVLAATLRMAPIVLLDHLEEGSRRRLLV